METQAIAEHIRRAKLGDAESFCALVEAFEYRVRGFIASRCPDRHLVDDLVQTTFIFVHRNFSKFEEGTNFLAWLMTIARFTVMAELKSYAKRARAHGRYIESALADEAVEAGEGGAQQAEWAPALSRCIGKLDTYARDFLHMRYVAQMSLQEICAKLAKSYGWGKSYFFRLKGSLRRCMKEQLAELT